MSCVCPFSFESISITNDLTFLLFTVSMVFGPPSQKVSSISTINTSMAIILQAIGGTWKADGIPPTIFPVYTDVRKLGIAHVKAAELDVAKGQRYLFIEGYYVCHFLLSLCLDMS